MNLTPLDTIFSRYVRLSAADDNGYCTCVTCGKVERWQDMDAAHFIPRQHLATRFLIMNVNCCCFSCNRLKHGNLKRYELYLHTHYGPDTVRVLTDLSRTTVKYTQRELNDLVKEYKLKLKSLEQ